MDIRKMTLIESPIKEISSSTMADYKCGPDRLRILEQNAAVFLFGEYWDPRYQAWKSYLDTYLASGVNPEMAAKYMKPFLEKEQREQLSPAQNKFSQMYNDALSLKGNAAIPLFDGVFFREIEQFCDPYCKFFISSQKAVASQLYSPAMYVGTINDLLQRGNWKSLMCALVLYRHCQLDDFSWPTDVIMSLQSRLGEWLGIYLDAFQEVTEFIGESNWAYSWYCPEVLTVIQQVWATALLLKDRPEVIKRDTVYKLSPAVASKLVGYVNSCPAVYDDPYDKLTVWNAVFALFGAENKEDPALSEKAFYALCVPRSYLSRMCNSLYDFYWMVKDKLLTSQLYIRKQVAYANGDTPFETPEAYLEKLYDRGFPVISKEEF